MASKIEKVLAALLLVNFTGICGFWTIFLFSPSEPLTLKLGTHIASEYATGILSLASFILFIRRSKLFNTFVLFSAGMLFYASLQATGWAVLENFYPLLALMVINIIVIGMYVFYRKT